VTNTDMNPSARAALPRHELVRKLAARGDSRLQIARRLRIAQDAVALMLRDLAPEAA
jgi:hypothetical protein